MTQVVIDNPILNSPFLEPSRHFRFDDQGITNEIVDGRRLDSAAEIHVGQTRPVRPELVAARVAVHDPQDAGLVDLLRRQAQPAHVVAVRHQLDDEPVLVAVRPSRLLEQHLSRPHDLRVQQQVQEQTGIHLVVGQAEAVGVAG